EVHALAQGLLHGGRVGGRHRPGLGADFGQGRFFSLRRRVGLGRLRPVAGGQGGPGRPAGQDEDREGPLGRHLAAPFFFRGGGPCPPWGPRAPGPPRRTSSPARRPLGIPVVPPPVWLGVTSRRSCLPSLPTTYTKVLSSSS